MDYEFLGTRGWLNDSGDAGAGMDSGAGPVIARASNDPHPGRNALLEIPPELRGVLGVDLLRRHTIFPLESRGETLFFAAMDPQDLSLRDRLSALTARRVELVADNPRRILGAIQRLAEAEQGRVRAGREKRGDSGASTLAFHAHELGSRPLHATEETVDFDDDAPASVAAPDELHRMRREAAAAAVRWHDPSGLDPVSTTRRGGSSMWFHVVEDGQRALLRRLDGTMEVVVGPCRLLNWRRSFMPMAHHVAHPGDYLIIRFRDGHQEHLVGPADVWFDPRIHQEVVLKEGLQLAAKEAVVVYSSKDGGGQVQRRVVNGPALFVPQPGEWLHTFSWHASRGGSKGVVKVPNGLVFQKLWLMPDQMYHDVSDVRTADDAVLTIRLMIFFELVDINTMLDATHDPIGDFVNAASSDVVDLVGRHDFDSFKRNTEKLNELETYRQLAVRAAQCGYRINKVVYRGYGAPERLQQMHDQAIEGRTRLVLERETERQSQQLEDYKLESQLQRSTRRRSEQAAEVAHEVDLERTRQQARLEIDLHEREFRRAQKREDDQLSRQITAGVYAVEREHFAALRDLGVELTAFLTQARADRVIEVRGPGGSTHLHLEPEDLKGNGQRPNRMGKPEA